MTAATIPVLRARPVRRLRLSGRKYLAAFRVSLRSQLAYPGEMALRLLFVVIIMVIFSSLWHTTFAELGRSRLGGLSLGQMLWYLAITESILLSCPRDSIRIDEEVRSGQLAYALARPYSYLLFRFAQVWGERLPRFALTFAAAVTLATIFSGEVGVSWSGVLAGLPVLVLALTVDYLLVLAICLLAFWVEDTNSFLFIYDRFLMILGGMLLPLELFPDALEQLARVLPFSMLVYAPARTFVHPNLGGLPALLSRQMVTLAVALALAGLLFRHAVRRLQANGG